MLGGREISAGQNANIEAMGAQTLPRSDSLSSLEQVFLAANDVERYGVPGCMKYTAQVPMFRIARVLIDKIGGLVQRGNRVPRQRCDQPAD